MTDDDIVRRVLDHEGGFVDDPRDRGGATNFGITAATLGDWRKLGRAATAAEVRAMPKSEAIAIYRQRYVADIGFGRIPDPSLRLVLVDAAVLHGPARAVKWLQTAVGVPADGEIGPATLAALAATDARRATRRVLALRYAHFAAIVAADPAQRGFLKGWCNRVGDLMVEFG